MRYLLDRISLAINGNPIEDSTDAYTAVVVLVSGLCVAILVVSWWAVQHLHAKVISICLVLGVLLVARWVKSFDR